MNEIDLSLSRVKEVLKRLHYFNQSLVITVAGTNGKGSTVKVLEEIYQEAGFSVGAFTSPYLLRYNEQFRVNGISCSDKEICTAFEKIKAHTQNVALTPFEYGTIAALLIFSENPLDVIILEVGLGGRLDAVNAIDADLSIVTTIAMDHMDWLGETREAIAREKAGVFRTNRPAICGDFDPPKTLIQYAAEIGAPLFCQHQQFGFKEKKSSWDWWSSNVELRDLPLPSLALQNVSSALMGVHLLQKYLPVSMDAIHHALKKVVLPGRIQVIPGDIPKILDVSHNPAAVEQLSKYLLKNPIKGKTHAVFSMLADKDVSGTIEVIEKHIDRWHIAPLHVPRGMSTGLLRNIFQKTNIAFWEIYESIDQAYENILGQVSKNDRIVIFGSFHTVAEVYKTKRHDDPLFI
jgi:dihydrofolate synthase/folylpolyglutamate synthase